MHLSRSADYALRAMIHLAGLPLGTLASGQSIAHATGVAAPFLHKVLRLLVEARLVEAQRGFRGGFRLALDPQQISMLRVVEAVDGARESASCTVEGEGCDRISWCGVHAILAQAQVQINGLLQTASIARLRRESEVRRSFVQSIDPATR